MGTGETRCVLTKTPALLDHVTEKLNREANVLKERCKMREERQASRGGGKGNVSASSLQSTINKQADEIKKLKSEQGASTVKGSGRQGEKGSS